MAEPVRLATWHGDFSRKGPGLLLREIVAQDKAVLDAVALIAQAAPDVLLLTQFDYDYDLVALRGVQALLEAQGHSYPHLFAARPNTGLPTGLDLDGDGLLGGPRDAQGYGWFAGQGGQAVLSRLPVTLYHDFSGMLWSDAPDTLVAQDRGAEVQRLSSSAHWLLRLEGPDTAWHLMTLAATPPVFDGPEDRNGRRNFDEVMLWAHVLDGRVAPSAPAGPVVVMGNFNLDPVRGDGLRDAARVLLAHPRLQDPLPDRPTVQWDGPGDMRVSYVLPSRDLRVLGAGVTETAGSAGPHRLVWVDLTAGPLPEPDEAPRAARLAEEWPEIPEAEP